MSLVIPTPTAGGNEADEITPEILELARGLRFNPLKIYEHVTNHIEFEPYYGCKKGAHLTLLEGSGNDFDQAALLVSLLRASGYSPSYKYGACSFSYEELVAWVGLSPTPFSHLTDALFTAKYGDPATAENRQWYAGQEFFINSGYYIVDPFISGGTVYFSIPHVWVQVVAGGATRRMAPAFKPHDDFAGIDLASAMNYNRTAFLAAATDSNTVISTPDSATKLSYTGISSQLTTYTQNLSTWLKDNEHKLEVDRVMGTRSVIQGNYTSYSQIDPIYPWSGCPWLPITTWSAIPATEMSKLRIQCGTYNYNATNPAFTTTLFDQTLTMPSLKGRKLSLSWSGNTASIRLDESLLGSTFSVTGSAVDIQLKASHNHYRKTLENGSYVDSQLGRNDQQETKPYLKGDSYAYAFAYSFGNPEKHSRARQEVLDEYRRDNLPEADWRVRTEVLNIMGLQWYDQTWRQKRITAPLFNVLPLMQHRFGRVAQEQSFYIDVGLQLSADASRIMDYGEQGKFFHYWGFVASAMEHGVIEQMQGEDQNATSTVKMIHLANSQGIPVYRATPTNWTTIRPLLINYGGSSVTAPNIKTGLQYKIATVGTTNFTAIGASSNTVGVYFIATGPGTGTGTATPTGLEDLEKSMTSATEPGVALLPKDGRITFNNWRGYGYAIDTPSSALMKISGGLFGGYNSQAGTVSAAELAAWFGSSPSYDTSATTSQNVPYTPYTTPRQYSSDPVDLLSGAFVVDKTEFTLGSGASPRGLAFSRHYNSARRYDNSPGLGYGWTHNYDIFLTKRSSVNAGLAGTISYHASPLFAAMLVSADLHQNQTTAKNWSTSALVVNWAIDQLKYNAVAVTMGNRTIEFIRMPDGSYEAPAGMNLTLVSHGSGAGEYFTMTERHGPTYTFNTAGRIATITDLWNQPQTFSYTDGLLTGVSDSYGRTLTFTRPAGRITSVSDSAGRTVSFGYNGDDLESCTDVENKTWTHVYNNHCLTESRDPSNRLIVTNVYDSLGRVKEQRTFGDNDKLYTFCYSGFRNSEEDPAGNITTWLYDDRGRSIATIDPVGNRTDLYYDGHDRKTAIQSPADEWTEFDHDKFNNPTTVTDPTDLDDVRAYDGQQRLQTYTDKRDNVTTVNSYNAQHQPLIVTAPLNRTTNTTYTSTGEVDTVTDAEDNVTDYDYNSLGQLWKVHVNGHLKVTYTYNAYGDVETQTDALSRVTSHTYNKRRQLRTTTLPAVPGEPAAVVEVTYDNEGMPQNNIDARLYTTSHTYSPTGKPLTTTLPAIPVAGGSSLNNLLTTTYNSRDLPDTAFNSLDHTTTFIHDGANRLTEIHDPLTRITRIGYDANSRPNSSTNGLNHTSTSNYTPRGEPWNTWDALTKNTRQTYDANGNPWERRNRRGFTHTTIYDAANRLHTSSTPLNHTTTTDYYDNDQVHVITEPSTQTTTLTYDDRLRPWTKTDAVGTITYGYTNADELWTVTEGADTITRTYDERSRLKTFTTADGDFIQYRYDANNNLARITYPPDAAHPAGKQVNYTYNARNLLETVTDWSNRVTTYQYDRLGRLTGIVRPNNTIAGFGHDDANQLQSIRETNGGKLFSYIGFKYDNAGQVKNRFRAPLVNSGWQHPSFSATCDNDNRLATVNGQTVTHDDDGNMTYGPITGDSGFLNLGYNARNQLTAADGISYSYDAEGRRRTLTDSTGTTRDVIDPAGRLLVRHNPDTSTTWYVYGLGLLYEADESDATKTYHFDQVGSTIARTDDTGKVIGRAEYSAYGLITWKSGDMATPFLYNGQAGVQTDPNGLLNMRARYYSPFLMRFLNADPSGFSGGPNWFAYADGNPISLSDPFGLCAENWQSNSIDCLTGKPYDSSIYGRRPASPITSEFGHTVLDGLGLIPGLGEFADGANGIWHAAEGNKVDAGLSFAGMIPFAGWGATGAKGLRYADESFEIAEGVRRSKAADMLNQETISARVIREGQADELVDLPLSTLRSPKPVIEARSLTDAERMASVLEGTRNGNMPPIDVRPGTRGTPIKDVKINYPGSP
jgi:RHS repeat-associated protein